MTGAVTSAGDEVTGRVTLSSLDPQQTFLRLLPSGLLDESFLADVGRYRYRLRRSDNGFRIAFKRAELDMTNLRAVSDVAIIL